MHEKEILFHFGAARSGTTYVNTILRTYYDYGLCSEGHFIARIGKRLRKYGSLEVDKNLRRLIDDVLAANMFEIFRTVYSQRYGRPMDVTAEQVWRNLPARSYAGVVYSAFRCVADQLHCSRVGNNFPVLSTSLTRLLDWFPRAKVLHVVRDGRDVALSHFALNRAWAVRSAFAAARRWVRVQEDAKRLEQHVPSHQYDTLYYERLLQYPEAEASKLEHFLNIALDPQVKSALIKSVEENEKRWNFGKWRKQMSQRDIRIYEAIAGDWLEYHGYERACERPSISSLEKLAYTGHELGRRVRQKLAV